MCVELVAHGEYTHTHMHIRTHTHTHTHKHTHTHTHTHTHSGQDLFEKYIVDSYAEKGLALSMSILQPFQRMAMKRNAHFECSF